MSKLKAVFFDLDDTLYTSFQAGDRYAYECMEKWAQETFGEAGHGFDAAFLSARKQLAAEQPDMPPIHDRVLFAQRALENMGLNAVPHARKAAAVYWGCRVRENDCASGRSRVYGRASRARHQDCRRHQYACGYSDGKAHGVSAFPSALTIL